ncbi:hypothetical protein ES703_119114 [subsurface metagenome]
MVILVNDPGDHLFYLFVVGEVGLDGYRLAAFSLDGLGRFLQAREVAGDQRQRGPFSCEGKADCLADTGGSAGDDGYLILELHGFILLKL